ncbi:hypothetical protein OROMI_031402 [Orobanche minor]
MCCLCPVGAYFNYTPPEEDPCHLNTLKVRGVTSSFERGSREDSVEDLPDANTDRLKDAG